MTQPKSQQAPPCGARTSFRRLESSPCFSLAQDSPGLADRKPVEPPPFRGQVNESGNILRAVNRRWKVAGYIELPVNALRMRRRIYRPFEPVEGSVGEEA